MSKYALIIEDLAGPSGVQSVAFVLNEVEILSKNDKADDTNKRAEIPFDKKNVTDEEEGRMWKITILDR